MLTGDIQKHLQVEFALIQKELTQIKWMSGILIAGVLPLAIKAFF